MDQLNIQWYPGHMTRARRMMEENLSAVDALCEVLDARIPAASRNPEIDVLASGKPRLIVLNRAEDNRQTWDTEHPMVNTNVSWEETWHKGAWSGAE